MCSGEITNDLEIDLERVVSVAEQRLRATPSFGRFVDFRAAEEDGGDSRLSTRMDNVEDAVREWRRRVRGCGFGRDIAPSDA